MKKVISLVMVLVVMLTISVSAADLHITDTRQISNSGWLDNFEEPFGTAPTNGYVGKGAGYTANYGLLCNANTGWGNYYQIAPDPLGKNGNSLMFYFSQYNKGYNATSNNNPIISTSAWQAKQPGYSILGAYATKALPGVVSFDMYLPEAFDKTADGHFTGINMRIIHGQDKTNTSETISTLQFRENKVTWDGIVTDDTVTTNEFEVPVGRWFTLKLIIDNYDVADKANSTADLWIDGEKKLANAKLVGTTVTLIDGNNRNVSAVTAENVNLFYMTRYAVPAGIEWEMVTS